MGGGGGGVGKGAPQPSVWWGGGGGRSLEKGPTNYHSNMKNWVIILILSMSRNLRSAKNYM